MARNPFTPNFGQIPRVLAGRDQLIDEIVSAFDNAPGDPSLTSILIGARGTGKTALLSLLANEAESKGWLAVNVPCVGGMLEEIFQGTVKASSHLICQSDETKLTGLTIGQLIGLEWEAKPSEKPTWFLRMSALLDELDRRDVGLLITVDEVRPSLEEMGLLASYYQLFVRDERKVALLMAGLPSEVSLLLNDKSASFLRRASQYHIGDIGDADAELVLERTAEEGEKAFTPDALGRVVEACGGFPYLIQLMGYRSWQAAGNSSTIDAESAERGISRARSDFETRVLKATLDELSDKDLEFLCAMAQDRDESRTSEIAERMGQSTGYVSQYRRRLLEQGVIAAQGRGKVTFALPFLKEYLKEYLGD